MTVYCSKFCSVLTKKNTRTTWFKFQAFIGSKSYITIWEQMVCEMYSITGCYKSLVSMKQAPIERE